MSCTARGPAAARGFLSVPDRVKGDVRDQECWRSRVGGRRREAAPADRRLRLRGGRHPGSGESEWRPSPGGLVTALQPVMRDANGAWVGWPGSAGDALEPFDADGMHLVTVGLSADEVRDFYEGFCNATLWPLYHDVIVPAEFRRPWWDAYLRVNQRFAEAAAGQA